MISAAHGAGVSGRLGRVVAAGAFGAAALAAAVLGSLATSSSTGSEWFQSLDKPPWYPPSSAFGIVWTVLYVMIAVAGYLAWRSGAPRSAVTWWGAQMALNLLWSIVFFGLRSPEGAVAVIVALAVSVAATIRAFRAVDRTAALLLVPYLGWVLFASTLNVAIVVLN